MTEHPVYEMQVDFGGGRQRTMPVELPSQSHMSRKKAAMERQNPPPDREKAEKVVTGEVIRKKPGFRRQFKTAFFGGRPMNDVVQEAVIDILVSSSKSMVSDVGSMIASAFKDGLDRALWGNERVSRPSGGAGHTNYSQFSRLRRQPEQYRTLGSRGRSFHEFDDVVIPSRGEAEMILDKLRLRIEDYGIATVEDYYDTLGVPSDYVDTKWGWNNLASASVRLIRGGYIIQFPPTHPID